MAERRNVQSWKRINKTQKPLLIVFSLHILTVRHGEQRKDKYYNSICLFFTPRMKS